MAVDCEDYAIAKYALALEAGFIKPEDARLLLVEDWTARKHFILLIGNTVLDNRSSNIVTIVINEDHISDISTPNGVRHLYYTILGELAK